MAQVKGKIEAVSLKKNKDNEDTFSLRMDDGNWYSFFGTTSLKKGDEVEFENTDKEVNGKVFHNGKSLKNTGITVTGTPQAEIRSDINVAGMRFGNCLNATSHYSANVQDNIRQAVDMFNTLVQHGVYKGSMEIILEVDDEAKN